MGQFRPSFRSRSALYPARPHHSPHVTDYSPVPLLCFLFLYRSLGFVRLLFVESSPWLNCQRKWMQITKDHLRRSSSTVHPVCNVIHSCDRKVLACNYSDVILYIFRHVCIGRGQQSYFHHNWWIPDCLTLYIAKLDELQLPNKSELWALELFLQQLLIGFATSICSISGTIYLQLKPDIFLTLFTFWPIIISGSLSGSSDNRPNMKHFSCCRQCPISIIHHKIKLVEFVKYKFYFLLADCPNLSHARIALFFLVFLV